MKGEHTEICACTVLELAALDRAIKTARQYELMIGRVPWTGRDRALLGRLRDVRGLNVIEGRRDGATYITIAGSLRPDGFTKVIGDCQKQGASGVYSNTGTGRQER